MGNSPAGVLQDAAWSRNLAVLVGFELNDLDELQPLQAEKNKTNPSLERFLIVFNITTHI